MKLPTKPFILSIYPFSRGFAFVLFEAPLSPLDWGIKEIRGTHKSARTIAEANRLLKRYHPGSVVLPASASTVRIQNICKQIASHAEEQGIKAVPVSRDEVRACFMESSAKTRQQIAEVIASRIEVLASYLPPPRKLWESENSKLRLFDATALVMARESLIDNVE